MDNTLNHAVAPAGWLEVLAESDADIAAGHIGPGEDVMRDLRESLARLETKAAARTSPKGTPGR